MYLATLIAVPVLFAIGYAVQATMLDRLMRPGETKASSWLPSGLSLLIANVLLLGFGGLERTIAAPVDANRRLFGAIAPAPGSSRSPARSCCGGADCRAAENPLGLVIRSVAANPLGAQIVGVDIRRVFALTFALGTASAGAAGGLLRRCWPSRRAPASSSTSWPSWWSCSAAWATCWARSSAA